ncbi:polysaccharide deacetylase family protein [Gammaproteobacteria bacterium]|nr:polysaccharide deacetylase family protein [Gammaproteobacteria bacterium]
MSLIFIFFSICVLSILVYASACIQSTIYHKSQCCFPTDKKEILLTFDDGIDSIQTPKVLEVLRKHQIKACFFVIGNKIAANESILQSMINDGHIIGSHTYSHAIKGTFQLTNHIEKDMKFSIQKMEQIMGKVELFRPPFGVMNPHISKAIKQLNLKSIGWSIRSYDTRLEPHETVLQRIQKKLHPGAILLLHDVLPNSELLLEKVIHMIHENGYTIVSPESLKNVEK